MYLSDLLGNDSDHSVGLVSIMAEW